jgi:ketosteroid isomerase-like protein
MKKPSGADTEDGPDYQKIFDTWIAGYDAGNVDQVMSIFKKSLRYFAPCQPVQTYETLAAWYENDFKRPGPRPTWSYVKESMEVGGDLAIIVSHWTAITYLDGFSADVERIRSIDFLRHGDKGWKIFRTLNDPECSGETPPLSQGKPPKKSRR